MDVKRGVSLNSEKNIRHDRWDFCSCESFKFRSCWCFKWNPPQPPNTPLRCIPGDASPDLTTRLQPAVILWGVFPHVIDVCHTLHSQQLLAPAQEWLTITEASKLAFFLPWIKLCEFLASLQNFPEALLAPERAKANFSASCLWNPAAGSWKLWSLCCSDGLLSRFRLAGERFLSSGCACVGRRPAHRAALFLFML